MALKPSGLYPLYRQAAYRGLTLTRLLVLFCLVLLVTALFKRDCPYCVGSQYQTIVDNVPGLQNRATRNVHLLLPASHKDQNLCKSMATASVLGYPRPIIINWNSTRHDDHLIHGGAHLFKLAGISDWLHELPPERDEDLVIGADAYDVWFQLRPEVLIGRYFDINRRANMRIRAEVDKELIKKHHIEQTIVFSSQKRCGIGSSEGNCALLPESTLPNDIFGPGTDVKREGQYPWAKYRPKHLNSGVWIGRVAPLRKLFKEAKRRAEEDTHTGSDQKVLMEMFEDQEAFRGNMLSVALDRPAWQKREVPEGISFEYGLGLDYESSISIPTVFSEDDLAWISHNDTDAIAKESRALEINPPRIREIAQEIGQSRLPYDILKSDSESRELHRKTWSEVPLFTNLWTGVVPAIVHHNAWRDNRKRRREGWWDRPWYFKDLRKLMDAAPKASVDPLAMIREGRGKATYYTSAITGAEGTTGAVSEKYEYLSWNELCDDYDVEVFRDLPRHGFYHDNSKAT